MPTLAYCPDCGYNLEAHADNHLLFCPNCGCAFYEDEAVLSTGDIPVDEAYEKQEAYIAARQAEIVSELRYRNERKALIRFFICFGLAIVMFVGAVLLFLVLSYSDTRRVFYYIGGILLAVVQLVFTIRCCAWIISLNKRCRWWATIMVIVLFALLLPQWAFSAQNCIYGL